MARTIPFLRGGFRPFFLGAAVWAVAALVIWLVALAGGAVPFSHMEPLAWHRHEMLFGFVGAAISGFLLTAIPNWTGRLPVAGWPLAGLFGWWLAGRLLPLVAPAMPPAILALVDGGFYLGLAAIAAREVVLAGNRNLPVVAVLFLFGLANLADHGAATGLVAAPDLAWRAGLLLVVLLLSLIGGRIIPSFTRNYLQRIGKAEPLPTQPGRFDRAVIAATALALAAWVAQPEARWVGLGLGVAAFLQLMRLARWQGVRTLADPLVFILHLAYLWIPVGLSLMAAAILGGRIPLSAAIHALTAGAMATMILAVMTRATLGHTGRGFRADGWTVFAYAAILCGAILRVAAPLGLGDYTLLMEVAAILWIAAFLLFLLAYAPKLAGPRADGKI